MCVRKIVKISILSAIIAVFGACGAMDTILPSSGIYKVNAMKNGVFLDECSFTGSGDYIYPFFEENVSGDPDVNGLMVYLKNNMGEVAGWRVKYYLDNDAADSNEIPDDTVDTVTDFVPEQISEEPEEENEQNVVSNESHRQRHTRRTSSHNEDAYTDVELELEEDDTEEDFDEYEQELSDILSESIAQLEEDYRNSDEIVFLVKNLDKNLPFFPIPRDMPMGNYTLVFSVLSGEEILQKTEKNLFYLADKKFSFGNIQLHFPGIVKSPQLVSTGTLVMLEAEVDFDSSLDPYVVWYDGKKIICEGNFSDGVGNLFWKTPEQSGFFSLRAEIFPVESYQNLRGYQKGISLLVSSKPVDMHLVSEDTPSLMQWYDFEGSLNDSKINSTLELAAIRANTPKWMPSGGTYGLVTGIDDVYSLPKVSFSNEGIDNWRFLFRFKPLSDGRIFSVRFGALSDIILNVSTEKNYLVLTLTCFTESVSGFYALPEGGGFITASLDFSIESERLTAQLNVLDGLSAGDEPDQEPVSIEAALAGEFEITLGSVDFNKTVPETQETALSKSAGQAAFTALWDEAAVFHRQFAEIEIEQEDQYGKEDEAEENQLALLASVNDDSIN